MKYLRGQVVAVDIKGKHWYVVVTNNQRNKALDRYLAARLTSQEKYAHLPTSVETTRLDPPPGQGWVLADAIMEIYDDEILEVAGTLTSSTMKKLDDALKIVFAL